VSKAKRTLSQSHQLHQLWSVNREAWLNVLYQLEQLGVSEVKIRTELIESAPASGLQGIYNRRNTSDIQARWEALHPKPVKRAEKPAW
jgi:hypothetical protein